MKLPCPSCKSELNLPDHLAGKLVKCPICGDRIDVPAVAGQASPRPIMFNAPPPDELSLQPVGAEAGDAGGLPKTDFCPNCGVKWRAGNSTCHKCSFNVALNRKLNPVAARRRISLPIDFTKICLLAALAGAGYGMYWLYYHWGGVEKDIKEGYDAASRSPITADSEKLGLRKDGKTLGAAGKDATTSGGKPLPETAEFKAWPVPKRVEETLADLRNTAAVSRGRARAVELARVAEAAPLLIKALETSLEKDSKESFEFRLALATALAASKDPAAAPALAACLTSRGASGNEYEQMFQVVTRELDSTGRKGLGAVWKALKEGDEDLKIGLITACERNNWVFDPATARELIASKSPRVRRAALVAICHKLRHPELAGDLVKLITDADPVVSTSASAAAAVLHKQALPLALDALKGDDDLTLARIVLYARPILASGDRSALLRLNERLVEFTGGEKPVPLSTGEALVLSGDEADKLERLARLGLSGKIEPPEAGPYVAAMLSDRFPKVRRRAAAVLQGHGNGAVVEALALACLDDDLHIAVRAADAPDAKSVVTLALPVWKAGLDSFGHRRVCCAGALHRLGHKEGTEMLRQVARNEGAGFVERSLALRFLGKDMSDAEREVPAKLLAQSAIDEASQRFTQAALARAGHDTAREWLFGRLRSPDSDDLKDLAMHEAVALGDARFVVPGMALVRSGGLNSEPFMSLCLALNRFPSRDVAQGYVQAMSTANAQAARTLSMALAAYKDLAQQLLQDALKSDDTKLRSAAMACLAEIGTKEAYQAVLQRLKEEKDQSVLAAGTKALARRANLPEDLQPHELEVLLLGLPPKLDGKWSSLSLDMAPVDYQIPIEMDKTLHKGLPWPGNPEFKLSTEFEEVGAEIVQKERSRITGKKEDMERVGIKILDDNLKIAAKGLTFTGFAYKMGQRANVVVTAYCKSKHRNFYLRVDFVCRETFWAYNKPLFEKILSTIKLRE